MRAQEEKRQASGVTSDGSVEEVDVTDEDELSEDLGYISPLENVDPYATFKTALSGVIFPFRQPLLLTWSLVFQEKSSALYQVSTSKLDVELQTILMETMNTTEQTPIN